MGKKSGAFGGGSSGGNGYACVNTGYEHDGQFARLMLFLICYSQRPFGSITEVVTVHQKF